ncbi:21763_t:CDS:2, partial [Cetraspora pellucida]
ITLADKALKEVFNNISVFTDFCEVMKEISLRALDLFHQNLEVRFKRLIDIINYNELVAAMTDNIKLKLRLQYYSNLEYIVGSVLSNEKIK